MTLPATHTVTWFEFDSDAEDELGNRIPAWKPGVSRKVIGWKFGTTEETAGFESREIVTLTMEVPAKFGFSFEDRMQLPGSSDMYEVTGATNAGTSFHGWSPGELLTFRLVK